MIESTATPEDIIHNPYATYTLFRDGVLITNFDESPMWISKGEYLSNPSKYIPKPYCNAVTLFFVARGYYVK